MEILAQDVPVVDGNDDGLIRYGISRSYLPKWGYQEAIREIYQNFTDFGEYGEKIYDAEKKGFCWVILKNEYSPSDLGFLRIGDSGKRDDKSTIGQHGEGLKMAFFVLARAGLAASVYAMGKQFHNAFYTDSFLGECFGISICEKEIVDWDCLDAPFAVSFMIPKNEIDRYRVVQIDPKEIIYSSSYWGDLIRREPGTVFVGGQFVAKVEGLKYAYNFKPEHIDLDRDRRIPRDFDVDYAASQILQSWDGMKLSDMRSRDARYMHRVPGKIAQKFKPSISKSGKVVFKAGNVTASSEITKSLMGMPLQQKRIAKLRYCMVRKQTPSALVKEFFDKHGSQLSSDALIDAQVLMKKSKEWKNG